MVRANPNILGFKPPCGEGWSARTVKVQQLADDTTFYVQKVSSLRELECIIGDFGDATNLRLNAQKTVGVWFGTDLPADLAAKYKWLKKGEMETSLGVIYGKALYPQDYVMPLLEKIRKPLAQLRGVENSLVQLHCRELARC